MRKFARKFWRDLVLESHGAEIAEAAAVLPLMFMILLGIFWFGQAFSLYGTITRAAQEGARAGSPPYCTTCAQLSDVGHAVNAVNAVNAALAISHLDPTLAQWPTSATNMTHCTAGTPVGCNLVSSNVCVQAPVLIVPPNGTGTGVCGMAVSFQYPFKFYLPYSSLNKRQILLSASANVRLEIE